MYEDHRINFVLSTPPSGWSLVPSYTLQTLRDAQVFCWTAYDIWITRDTKEWPWCVVDSALEYYIGDMSSIPTAGCFLFGHFSSRGNNKPASIFLCSKTFLVSRTEPALNCISPHPHIPNNLRTHTMGIYMQRGRQCTGKALWRREDWKSWTVNKKV